MVLQYIDYSGLLRINLTFGAFKSVENCMSFKFESSLRPYDGSAQWSTWFDRFETIASFAKWEGDEERAKYLIVHLEGVPLRIVQQLPEASRKSCQAIAARLRDAFQPSAQESHQLLLKRRWQLGQSVEELYYDLVMHWRASVGPVAERMGEDAQTAAVVPFFYSALPLEVSRQLRLLELPLDNADQLLKHARTLIACFTEAEEAGFVGMVQGSNKGRSAGALKGRGAKRWCKNCRSKEHTEKDCRFKEPVCRLCFQPGHFGSECPKNGKGSHGAGASVASPARH